MEEILFWLCHCYRCGDTLSDKGPEVDEEDNFVCCDCGNETGIHYVSLTRSKLDQLDRDTLIKVKETINGLIEKKTAEMRKEG